MNINKENETIRLRRMLQRFTNYQIKKLLDGRKFEDVIKLDDNYILRSDDDKIMHLIRLQEDGMFERHQFRDSKVGVCQKSYDKWYDKSMNNTYFNTIKAGDLFALNDYEIYNGRKAYNGNLTDFIKLHSFEEINSKMDFGYSISTIIKSLNALDPFLIFSLICKNVKVEKIDNIDYVTGIYQKDGNNIKVAANFIEKDVYEIKDDNKLEKKQNLYELLFKHYRMPIFTVINSINNETDHFLCPDEGLGKYYCDNDISLSVRDILKTKTYQDLKK